MRINVGGLIASGGSAPATTAACQRRGAISTRKARQTQQRLKAVAWDDNDLIFCNAVGRHFEATNLLWRSFRPLRERAGLPKKLRFHDLRHSAATLLLLQGVNVKVVSEMLGHESVSLTLDVYSHVLPSMESAATAKMEELLTTDSGGDLAPGSIRAGGDGRSLALDR